MVTWDFIDEHQGVVGEIFEQGGRRLARLAAGEIARIVLDAGAGAGGFHHFEIKQGALFEALRFKEAAGAIELLQARQQLGADQLDRLVHGGAGRDVVGIGEDADEGEIGGFFAGERVELGDGFDLVAQQGDAPGGGFIVGGEDFDGIAAHPEGAAHKAGIAALVLQRHELGQQLALVDLVALLHVDGHGGVIFHRADTVNARHRGDDDHVVALEDGARGRVAHAVDLLVDGGFFFDIGVGARHIGFGLVVIVVGDEILDRVIGEERLELAIELGGEGLVGREDQRRAIGGGDHLGGGKGLARAGDAEQHLVGFAIVDAFHQLGDGGGLVAGGLIGGDHAEGMADILFDLAFGAVRHPGGGALHLLAAMQDDLLERLDRGGDAHGLGVFQAFALARLGLFGGVGQRAADLGEGLGVLGGLVAQLGGGDMAEPGLRGFAQAIEIDAIDGVGLGFGGARRHAGDGVVAGFGGAALFQGGQLALGGLLGLGGFLGSGGLGRIGGGCGGLVGTIHPHLVAHALGIKRLAGGKVLGFFDLAEEIVDRKLSFAGARGFVGHGSP